MTENDVVLALGGNTGDTKGYFEKALARLKEYGEIQKISSFIKTAPEGYADQPPFLNGVILFKTALPPQDLLTAVKQIERGLGRTPTFLNGPREIDIDIIFYGGEVIDTPSLVIPHPRMHERRFVLGPLCEISPDFPHPVFKKTVKELFKNLN